MGLLYAADGCLPVDQNTSTVHDARHF